MTVLRSFFWLYRPTAPSARAQSIQVVSSAHALAERGHAVTVCVRSAGGRPTAEQVLDHYGLRPTPTLRLLVLPAGGTASALAFRAAFLAWAARTSGGVAIARSKRYAVEAKRWFGQRFHLVLEAHEVDSLQAAERGGDPAPWRDLERRALRDAIGVIANCPGTLGLLRDAHPDLPPAIACHNATLASRARRPVGPGDDVGYVGSLLGEKDLATVAAAAARLDQRIVLVGPTHPSVGDLQRIAGGRLVREDTLEHRAVPDRLARFRTLVLPLGHGLFGDRLTSPLKLWDYLASGRPIAGADTAALRDAAPAGSYHPWTPGDPASLAAAIGNLDRNEALRARVVAAARIRTWGERAAEVERFVDGLLA